MQTLEQVQQFLQKYSEPCFVADFYSHEVIFQNIKMEALLKNKQDVVGRVFYDVIRDDSQEADYTPVFDWDAYDEVHSTMYSAMLVATFEVLVSHITCKGKEYLLCIYTKYQQKNLNEFDFESAMSQSVMALGSEDNVQSLLSIIGEFYQSDSVYLCKIDKLHKTVELQESWSTMGARVLAGDLTQFASFDTLWEWFGSRTEFGILENTRTLSYDKDSLSYQILHNTGLKRLVLYVITDRHGEPSGLLVSENAQRYLSDYRLFLSLERFLEIEFSKSGQTLDLAELTKTDMLTGFYSRSCYSADVDALQVAAPKKLGVVFANVNGLKIINTEYGFSNGDSIIKKSSEVIKEYFSENFYRISGDEFVGFFPEIEKEALEEKVARLQSFIKENDEYMFAVGLAWAEGSYDVVQLIKEADTVMYINKQEHYHSSKRNFQDVADQTLSQLLACLEEEEFMIYLQPQVKLVDGSLNGAEALIRRFDKKKQKMVFPDQFIPQYEKKSIIRHVDVFVIEQVCQLLQTLQDNGKALFPISVNLSRVTLLEHNIVDTVVNIVDKYDIPREFLIIEVTERVGLIENNVASSLVRDFKAQGFKISLDDFGCAYSNIVTLAQIDVDEVKLDKSLVDYITTNRKNNILVENVLRMCTELDNISTLAEGIEDKEQSDMLYGLGCHLGQGYYFSRPIPVEEFCQKYIH